MNEFFDFQRFMPHGHCYLWRPDILWTSVISNAIIAIAYFSIPFCLLIFISRRQLSQYAWLVGLFAAFIVLCGIGHILDIITVWTANYPAQAIVRALTAIASLATAVALVPLMPRILALRTARELEDINAELMLARTDLSDTIDKLEVSNKELEKFAFVASHDLQEPLRKLMIFSELLASNKVDDAMRDKYLDKINESASRMRELVKSVLELSQMSSAPRQLAMCDLSDLADQAWGNLSVLAQEKSAELRCDDLPSLPVDATQIRSLFYNLFHNALKYSHPERPPEVRVHAERGQKCWQIRITDNGAGIPAEYHEKIFESFHKLHGSSEGTGLGLSLCRKIAERHDGTLVVEQSTTDGTTFFLTLPASDS